MIYQNKEFNVIPKGIFFEQKSKQKIEPKNCIFLDVETVRGYKSYFNMPTELQSRWDNKVENWIKFSENSKAKLIDAVFEEFEKSKENVFDQNLLYNIYQKNKEVSPATQYKLVGGLYPEYGKIVCISVGYYKKDGSKQLISFIGEEYQLLLNFQFAVQKVYEEISKRGTVYIVGHNIGFFDIPFITKRMAINGLLVPSFIHMPMVEPWNRKILDTATEWRAGSTTGDATLETLSIILGIKNPKSGDLTGANLGEYWYSDDGCNVNKVVDYCEGDVESNMELFEYLQNLKVATTV